MEISMPAETAWFSTTRTAFPSPIAPVALNRAVCEAIDKVNPS